MLLGRKASWFLSQNGGMVQNGAINQLSRLMSVAPECKKPEAALTYEDAKPFNEIPSVSFFQILWRTMKGDPNLVKNKVKFHLFFGGLFKENQTNILRMTVPGVPTTVMIQDPEDVKTLITGDDKNPVSPGSIFS